MIRTATKSTLLAVALLSMGTATVGCNKSSSNTPQTAGNSDVGSVRLALRVPGVQVDVIHWDISQGTPPTSVRSGDHNVPQTGPSAAFLVTALNPGPYRVTLTANATPNATNPDMVTCTGSGDFAIVAGQTAHVSVILNCTQTPSQGGVAVDTIVQFEDCPYLTSYLVSSTQPGIGGVVDVSSAAADRDPSLPLTYAWSATAPAGAPVGTFANAAATTTTFTCPAGYNGVQTLSIYVTNGVSKKPLECPLARESILVLCVPTNCGDGVVQPQYGEACDLGLSPTGARLNGPGSGCSFSCTSDTCGNGMLDPGEACDSGSANGPMNRCSLACTITPRCGDGTTDAPETCDDGNTTSGDGCSATCVATPPVCGNSVVEVFPGFPAEQCDDGNTNQTDACRNCVSFPAVCGNGMLETYGGEQCDDGNTTSGDGCQADCRLPPVVCGDGMTQGSETCDDGNTTSLDGCSSTCYVEPVCYTCREQRRGVAGSTGCNALMGCENLADATDKALCYGLLNCMYANPTCWAVSPVNCYCGTATGLECTTAPNGVCRTQTLAAAKVGPSDFTNGSVRFFNTMFPSGHASQEMNCNVKCLAAGSGPCDMAFIPPTP